MLSAETVAIEALRKLRDVVIDRPDPEAHLIRVNPKVARELMRHDSGLLELEEETGKTFHFEGGDALPIDTFEVVESGERAEIEERALPFQVGEEVLLRSTSRTCTTPATRSPGSTRCMVSVTGAAPLVGERKLVRIEEVGRSSGVATLLDGIPEGSGDDESADGLESGTRRRGRRGGRRRSRAGSGSNPGQES